MNEVGFPWSKFSHRDLEFHDQLSFLKGGMAAADVVTAVSPSYAHEILTPTFGEALDGFLRSDIKRLVGIVNGIDTELWNPETDPALPAPFSAASLANKAVCRSQLAAELRLDLGPQQPLIAVIARMTAQKGLDLVGDIVPLLHRLDAKLVVLGSGEPEYEARFRWLAEVFGAQVAVAIGFDSNLAHRIYAGSDLFLMPSRFEPCGLGQLYAMRYGAIPIVSSVGGLRDTVTDVGSGRVFKKGSRPSTGTGFVFSPASAPALLGALERAVTAFRDEPTFSAIRRSAMSRDSSWTVPADQYLDLYRSLRS
jgi:starch synthase